MNSLFNACIIAKCKDFLNKEKTRFVTSCFAVFVLGLMAHAYGFLNFTIGHDSLYEFYLSRSILLHKIELGRFISPIYQFLFHGQVTLPWLNGFLALCWLSVSVWMIAYMFSIADKLRITLIAGFLTVNVTVTALTATYVHDLDADMFAVMLAVCMSLLWAKGGKAVWLGVPLLVLVFGIYQSIVSVSISLVMIFSILALLHGKKLSDVVRKGLQAVLVILIAGTIYYFAVKLSCLITKIELSSGYNGLSNLYNHPWNFRYNIKLLRKTYSYWRAAFLYTPHFFSEMYFLHTLLMIPVVAVVIYAMRTKLLPIQNKVLILCLGALLPLGMNLSCFLANGMVHTLMLNALWLIYLLVILMTDWCASVYSNLLSNLCRMITYAVLVLILAANVKTANNAYVKRDLERQATLSLMTRVNAEMNRLKGYIPGKTAVVFIGTPRTGECRAFRHLYALVGLGSTSPITYTHIAYFRFVLQSPVLQSRKVVPKSFTDSMEVFPAEGSMQWYGDTLVVKLSD